MVTARCRVRGSGTPTRRRTYAFALEQAEQMFHAAVTVGVAESG
jgi:hypothetical protein